MVKQTTTVTYHPNDPIPEAYIAVNKNRVKVYDNGKVFLKNKQTFQIELYNPTKADILAVIYINNVKIEGGGIILRPAERVFLERYLTENRKFVFSTYTASGTRRQLEEALEDNGVIRIEFHREQRPFLNSGFQFRDHLNELYNKSNIRRCKGSNERNIGAQSFDYSLYSHTFDASQQNINFCSCSMDSAINEVETGKIEKGGSSDQSFQYVDKDFETQYFTFTQYQLLPVSQQRVYGKETYKVRRYCENCGNKVSAKANFCPNCGSRI